VRILVIGAGQMGAGIAQVAAAAGQEVLLHDVDGARVAHGVEMIAKNLARAVERGKLTPEERGHVLSHIDARPKWENFDVDVAIEAATENEKIKFEIFRRLDEDTPPDAILASNTSSISITKIGAQTKRPDRVIGMHYMNPVPVMRLVEIIRGIATSQATFDRIHALALTHGKTPVEVRNFPGFVSNRVLCPMLNEAICVLYEGVGTVESIDTVMKLGMNHPMGPLELADFIGLDTLLAIMNVLYEGFKDPKYRPSPLLQEYVDAGWLGRKSGRGFYLYDGGSKAQGAVNGASPAQARQ
jgi:3-hydroxybutyryl-CoA dehydrogenase